MASLGATAYHREKARVSDQIESNWGRNPLEVDPYPRHVLGVESLSLLLLLSEICNFDEAKEVLGYITQTRRRRGRRLKRGARSQTRPILNGDISAAIRGVSINPAELLHPKVLQWRCFRMAVNGVDEAARPKGDALALYHSGTWKSVELKSLLPNFFTGRAEFRIKQETKSYIARLDRTIYAESASLGDEWIDFPNTEVENMYFSLFQQALRQDPLLYTAMVALRSDNEWELQSNPLCARYRLFSPEFEGLKPGVRVVKEHKSLKRPLRPLVTLTKGFAGEGSQNAVVCAFIWLEPTSKMDKRRLEYLRNSNLECEILRNTPDGNIQPRGQSERHPATRFFPPCSAIGSALLGQRSWKNKLVVYELSLLFGSDEDAARDYVWKVRTRIEATWERLFEKFKQEEELHGAELYGAELYGAEWDGTELDGAEWCDAELYAAELDDTEQYGTELDDAELDGTEQNGTGQNGEEQYDADSVFGAAI